MTSQEKERIPLLLIYKHDGQIKIEVTDDAHSYELYGFLKCYLKKMEQNQISNIKER